MEQNKALHHDSLDRPSLAPRTPYATLHEQLGYALAALESIGAAAAVADADNRLLWSSPAFDQLAEPTRSYPRQALLETMLAAAGPAPNTADMQVAVFPLAEAGQRLVVAQHTGMSPQAGFAQGYGHASRDALTGLPDRTMLQSRLVTRFESPRPFALLFIDVDNFKQINDTLGHLAGDEALHELAGRMRQAVRGHDFLARFGGDEFVAIIEGVDCQADLEPLLERLSKAVAAPLAIGGQVREPSVSVGAALSVDDYESCHAMLHAADLDMYATRLADPSRRSLAPSC